MSGSSQNPVNRDQATQTDSVGDRVEIRTESLQRAPSTISSDLIQQIQEDEARAANLAATPITFTRSASDSKTHLKIQLKAQKFTRNWPASVSVALASIFVMLVVVYWADVLPAKLQKILWSNPQTTIFTVGLLSYLTVSLLDALIIKSCNILRWLLCSRVGGVSLVTFTSLGDVGPLQIIWLLVNSRPTVTKSDIFWGFQRYFTHLQASYF